MPDATTCPTGAVRFFGAIKERQNWVQLQQLHERLAERELTLQINDQALAMIVEAGFDPVYGARPLKRVIQQRIENPLAQHLLAGDFSAGDTIVVELITENNSGAGGRLSFKKQSIH